MTIVVRDAGEGVDCKVAMFLNGRSDKIALSPVLRPDGSVCVTLNRRVFPRALRFLPEL